jgi:hypothetical protein
VYDESRGTFDGSSDTVQITVTGGGKSRTIPVVLTKNEILLGETKYYYVANVDGWPKIRETSSTSVPEDLIPDFEWGDEPVEVVESGLNSGKRLGVYWERGKPIPNGTGNLPGALIRLVGRYWHADSLYKVRLTAADPYETVSLVVEVKKPDVLGDPELLDQARHSIVKDVTNSDLDLDALIIKYAGENGLPPQIIKGQIEKETSFKPAWRYEPFTDLQIQKHDFEKYFALDLPFNVLEAVPNDLPASHMNVSPTPYLRDPGRIDNLAVAHWFDRYVRRGAGADPDVILGYKPLTRFWFSVYWTASTLMDLAGVPIGIPDLKRYTHDFVKARILDGTYDRDFSKIAQTRKVASYGYVQMMYITAVDFSWKETGSTYGTIGRAYVDKRDATQYPEKLNEQDFLFPRYSDFTLFDLRVAITEAIRGHKIEPKKRFSTQLVEKLPEANWPTGFEQVWARTMQRHNYYEGGYSEAVMLNSKKYLPARK